MSPKQQATINLRRQMNAALYSCSIGAQQWFRGIARYSKDAWQIRMKQVDEQKDTNPHAREVYLAYIKERLK